MKLLGIAGWSGAGKTTLVVKLIAVFRRAWLARRDREACPS